MRILYLTSGGGRRNACVHYRCILPALKLHHVFGWEVQVAQFMGGIDPACEEAINKADIVVCTRHGEWAKVIGRAKDCGKVAVYDTDDFALLDWHNPVQKIAIRQRWQKKTTEALRMAHYATVSTEMLKEEYQPFNPRIYVLPNMLDLNHPMWKRPKELHEGVVIGYYGGFSHVEDLKLLRGVFGQLCREFDSVKVAIGAKEPRKTVGVKVDQKTGRMTARPQRQAYYWPKVVEIFRDVPQKRLLPLEYKQIDEYGEVFAGIDIVVVPLCDTRFNRSKSNLKILEAGAYGLAVVASNVRPYQKTIEHGHDGFLARNGKDFHRFLRRLITNEELRVVMGRRLRKKVERRFDINTGIRLYHKTYQGMMDNGA